MVLHKTVSDGIMKGLTVGIFWNFYTQSKSTVSVVVSTWIFTGFCRFFCSAVRQEGVWGCVKGIFSLVPGY